MARSAGRASPFSPINHACHASVRAAPRACLCTLASMSATRRARAGRGRSPAMRLAVPSRCKLMNCPRMRHHQLMQCRNQELNSAPCSVFRRLPCGSPCILRLHALQTIGSRREEMMPRLLLFCINRFISDQDRR